MLLKCQRTKTTRKLARDTRNKSRLFSTVMSWSEPLYYSQMNLNVVLPCHLSPSFLPPGSHLPPPNLPTLNDGQMSSASTVGTPSMIELVGGCYSYTTSSPPHWQVLYLGLSSALFLFFTGLSSPQRTRAGSLLHGFRPPY